MLLSLFCAVVLAGAFLAVCYRKAGPGETHVIYGWGRALRLVSGPGGYLYFPLVQSFRIISREPFVVKFESHEVFITKGVMVEIDGNAQIRVRDDEESLTKAGTTFLNKNERERTEYFQTIIDDACRLVLKGTDPERLIGDIDGCAAAVREQVVMMLEKTGCELQSFVFTEVKDRIGYLSALIRRITAEEKARLAVEEAYITREGKTTSMMIKRDAQMQRIGMSLEDNRQLDMAKVMKNTEQFLSSMKNKLERGVTDITRNLYGKDGEAQSSDKEQPS